MNTELIFLFYRYIRKGINILLRNKLIQKQNNILNFAGIKNNNHFYLPFYRIFAGS